MPKQIIIAEQHRIAAVFEADRVQELVVATGTHQVGDIYLGIVENVLPGIDAAFVNIGDPERNGFIHVSDLGPLRLKRSSGAITELLAPQQKALVQIMKEPTGTKGPRLTGNITLPGRYLVLMPYGRGVNLSRRIRQSAERSRLRALAILSKPAGMGMLVRTEAEGMPEEAILEDLEILQKQWENIQQETQTVKAPALLSRDDDFIQRVLREMYSTDVNRIVVDSASGYKRVKQHLVNWNRGKSPRGVSIDQHRERTPVLEYFRVNATIREALKPRVELPSGGYLVIEPTEALTVIDVNSGSFTRSATARETVLWTNCEAATEIARQLRLRNMAGVIVVDFIDMDSRRDQMQVLEQFNNALKADKAKPQIVQLSELGLVELTRKRQGKNIYELFGHTCPTCGGLGHLVRLPGEGDTPAVEPTPATQPEEPLPTIEDRASVEAGSEWQELELLNHPNYQEVGSSSRRRRRRRDDAFGREEETEAPDTSQAPAPPMPSKEKEIVADSAPSVDTSPKEAKETKDFKEPKESKESKEPKEEAYSSRTRPDTRSDKGMPTPSPSSRGDFRRKSRDSKSELPEQVTVEMTPEQQQVYAMMGISPLILADRPVKNPKNAVVTVKTPGEDQGEASWSEAWNDWSNVPASSEAESEEATAAPVSSGEEFQQQPSAEPLHTGSSESRPTPATAESGSSEGSRSEEKPTKTSSNEETEKSTTTDTRRRRRRRSSAS
ncbi:Rne/Rng family ribonuclease [Geitlerinema sp. PCC 9228]|jgi:ribonuclease E|uniref:Rne/Rng family ribonuclease n=1 Tax=Geitlerinema sp. PCC 9228 TaxID=111611 RepID=UPI0008F9C054|nr:Rne/Rng family ribonuclease [Geitlerinema sp. PCC 9228]